MPESVAQPVNATSTNTTPAPKAPPAAPKGAPPADTAKKVPDFKSKVEETLWRVNEPTADEVEDTKSMSEIIDNAVSNASRPSKEATPERADHPEAEPEPEKPTQREKLKVGEKEYELDYEQMRRFAQKGIMHDLKQRDISAKAREAQAKAEALAAKEQELASTIEALKSPDQALEILVALHGEEKAREMLEGWLRPRIEREMLPPEERQQLEWQERAERAERALQERDERDQKTQLEQQASHYEEHYQKVILDALEKGGYPKGSDLTPFAKEMAAWMERGLSKNIEYTPEQLVELVNEDNQLRVGALTHTYVSQIEAAKAKGDIEGVISMGEKLVGILGEPVMYAIGKYHLAKMQKGQPAQPKPVLDTAKTDPKKLQAKQPKLTEDEYREMRRKIVHGEMEPPPWW